MRCTARETEVDSIAALPSGRLTTAGSYIKGQEPRRGQPARRCSDLTTTHQEPAKSSQGVRPNFAVPRSGAEEPVEAAGEPHLKPLWAPTSVPGQEGVSVLSGPSRASSRKKRGAGLPLLPLGRVLRIRVRSLSWRGAGS